MKKILFLITCTIIFSCSQDNSKTESNSEFKKNEQIIDTLKYEKLSEIVNKKDNVLYVVNFWATWCKPCVDELPEFMEVNNAFKKNDNYKMILVSLDKASEMEKKVKPFIKKNNITTDVYLLNDTKRMNKWIPAFHENWDGAIPTTIFYKNGKKLNLQGKQLSKNELEILINKYI